MTAITAKLPFPVWVFAVLRILGGLVVLLAVISTLLFFMLRLAGDPAYILAGADASPDQIAAIRAHYGLDRPLVEQWLTYLYHLTSLDFGNSLASGEPAFGKVMAHLPVTLGLAVLSLIASMAISLFCGAWLGARAGAPSRRVGSLVLFVFQGIPGFVTALLLIELFAVQLRWLPSFGDEGWQSWVLPTLSLAAFLAPKLTRIVASNLSDAMGEDYVRTAWAIGANRRAVLWRHALPNTLLSAVALLGAQFAFVLSGAVIVETIFVMPGMGWLLIQSARNLDFPVVQALTFVVAILVFAVNLAADYLFRRLDPRLRRQATAR